MKIAIVDDSKNEADILRRLLIKYSAENRLDLSVEYFNGGEAFVESLNKESFDAAFMDIYMNEMDGIETSRRLWDADSHCLLIFLTTSREHIWQATSLHCFDYIPKDQLSFDRISATMDGIRKKNSLLDSCITFTSGSKEIIVRLNDVQFILSNGNYTDFTMTDGQVAEYRIAFSSIYDMLSNRRNFVQCNRGVIINMDHIASELSDSFEMKGGQRLPIRKRDRAGILDLYHDYLFSKLDEM